MNNEETGKLFEELDGNSTLFASLSAVEARDAEWFREALPCFVHEAGADFFKGYSRHGTEPASGRPIPCACSFRACPKRMKFSFSPPPGAC